MKRERNGGKTGRWERNRGSVGGKAKQVYVEKRKKQEEERGAGNRDMETKERADPWWGLNFWGKHTNPTKKLQKCAERDISIPTLNEQLTRRLP